MKIFRLGNEAPPRAHSTSGEHALQVSPDHFTVVGGTGGLDGEVEFVGTDRSGAHLSIVLLRRRGDAAVFRRCA